MDISAGLIAKGTAGALAASAAVGGGIWANDNDWFGLLPSGDESKSLVSEGASSNKQPSESLLPENVTEGTRDPGSEGAHESVVEQTTGNPVGTLQSSIKGTPTGDGGGSDNGLASAAQNQSQGPTGESGGKKQSTKITKWDKALIDYLNEDGKDDRDIVFDVKTGNKTKVDLTNVFPDFEEDTQKKLVITVSVTTSDNNLKGSNNSEKIEELKKMNGGEATPKDWSWECKITLSKEKKEGGSINLENKEKIIGNNGYFNRLKKMISAETGDENKKNLKELKTKFIENCVGARGRKSDALTDEKIITEKTFKFKNDNTDLEEKDKKDKKDFDAWFLSTQAQ